MKRHHLALLPGLLLAVIPSAALTASMDSAFQEGMTAGKGASGIHRADPHQYVEHYRPDDLQQARYHGVTETRTDMQAQGQRELMTSELGQTLRAAYVKNAPDHLRPDAGILTCQPGMNDPDCRADIWRGTQTIDDACGEPPRRWPCAPPVQPGGEICGSPVDGADGHCTGRQHPAFRGSVAQLAALARAGQAPDRQVPGAVTVLPGRAMSCRKSAAGFRNCCRRGGWGLDRGLAHCNAEERTIGQAKAAKRVVSLGSWCARKTLGICLQRNEGYCVFDGKLARIVQEQGRRGQLGIGFGSAEAPDCRGLTLSELQRIQFQRLDFSDVYADLDQRLRLPDPAALQQRILSDLHLRLRSHGGGS